MLQTYRRDFVIRLASLATVVGSGAVLTACGGGDDAVASFNYGVASGDPLADRVILWTHAQYDGVSDDVALTWEVATDAAFTMLVASGSTRAMAAASFTAKVDATGLSAGKDYFFRFRAGNHS